MKPRLFIGSSSESIAFLNEVKLYIEPHVDVVAWTHKDVFSPNKGTLESLVKQTKLSDFSILIATKDDIVDIPSRGITKQTARDNVIFEFGLFLGATSLNRAFLLAEEGIDLPSDMLGVSVLNFSTDSTKYNYFQKKCDEILSIVNQMNGIGELGFVPSTALAIGYFHSFVKRTCEEISRQKRVTVERNNVSINSFQLYVIIPDDLDESGVDSFKENFNISRDLEPASTVEINPTKRGYPFHFKIDPPGQDLSGSIDAKLYDVPTTLNTILEALKLYYPSSQIGTDRERENLEKRELKNFGSVLKYLISKNSWTKNNVQVLEDVVI
ncbi:nucleotide-binding protein [Fibrella sp. HMF5335]|uniref:CD-NTase-associated protein 12 n=1 Tax=Fibrella rubiginis TaxID=2817060 RepID=A0A939GGR5_9BACT|nr:STING domain-containing protein [Fibrella rubiginis]MBO0938704.1 nucleotide-binding protein [Fibrella rubiginis]